MGATPDPAADGPAHGPSQQLYRVEHRTTYRYSDAVSASYGRGYLRPRDLPWQDCLDHRWTVDPAPSDAADAADVFGNTHSYFQVTTAHRRLVVTGVSTVRVRRSDPDPAVAGLPFEAARPGSWADRPAGPGGPGVDPVASDLVLPSPLVEVTDEVRRYAADSFRPGRPIGEGVDELTGRIHADFRYRPGSTVVGTPVSQVLRRREGVCQDFAHLAVACLRSQGLAARYVSGYLATRPAPGRPRLVGADASHAWVAVRLADGSWLASDPTNDTRADERHVTVAVGRDYRDVPPLRGVLFTDARESRMTVSVDTRPLDDAGTGPSAGGGTPDEPVP
ncbi:transglutaminase family protein [Nakamurella endophytica]|uniref:transglutaminase family protein n=1 Tax=Nakamurella endophytica TaxID=1748367 RepID=UPI00166338D1